MKSKEPFTSILICFSSLARGFIKEKTVVGDKSSKDKGKREQQKKDRQNPKEKRRLKREKKDQSRGV